MKNLCKCILFFILSFSLTKATIVCSTQDSLYQANEEEELRQFILNQAKRINNSINQQNPKLIHIEKEESSDEIDEHVQKILQSTKSKLQTLNKNQNFLPENDNENENNPSNTDSNLTSSISDLDNQKQENENIAPIIDSNNNNISITDSENEEFTQNTLPTPPINQLTNQKTQINNNTQQQKQNNLLNDIVNSDSNTNTLQNQKQNNSLNNITNSDSNNNITQQQKQNNPPNNIINSNLNNNIISDQSNDLNVPQEKINSPQDILLNNNPSIKLNEKSEPITKPNEMNWPDLENINQNDFTKENPNYASEQEIPIESSIPPSLENKTKNQLPQMPKLPTNSIKNQSTEQLKNQIPNDKPNLNTKPIDVNNDIDNLPEPNITNNSLTENISDLDLSKENSLDSFSNNTLQNIINDQPNIIDNKDLPKIKKEDSNIESKQNHLSIIKDKLNKTNQNSIQEPSKKITLNETTPQLPTLVTNSQEAEITNNQLNSPKSELIDEKISKSPNIPSKNLQKNHKIQQIKNQSPQDLFFQDTYNNTKNSRSDKYEDLMFEYNKNLSNIKNYKIISEVPDYIAQANKSTQNRHLNKIYFHQDYIKAFFAAVDQENLSALERFFIEMQNEYIVNENGDNALIYAVRHKKNKVVKYLLKRGFDVKAQNNCHQNAINIALMFHNYEALEILKKY